MPFIAPTYQQAERIAFEYLKEATKVFPGVKYNAAKLRCEIPHPEVGKITIFLLSGSSEPSEQIRGMYMDAVVMDEYQDLPPKTVPPIVRPALADRRGKCLWIGTPKGENAFKSVCDQAVAEVEEKNPDWYVCLFPASKTNVLPQSELDELRAQMSDNEYRQELECDWGANITGAF